MKGSLRDTAPAGPSSPVRQRGDVMRELRVKDGYSQTALAKKAGMTQANYWRLENEVANARRETLNKIARALAVPVVTIMRDPEETASAVPAVVDSTDRPHGVAA